VFALLTDPAEARTDVDALPEDVWATISDPETYPDWLVGAQRIRRVDRDFPVDGSGFDHSVGPTAAVTVDDSTVVKRADPPHRLDLRVDAGLFHADVELLVLPGPSGSEVRFTERPVGPAVLLTPWLRPVLRARNRESLRRLRGYVRQCAAAARQAGDPDRPPSGTRAREEVRRATDAAKSGAAGAPPPAGPPGVSAG
jgi:uncharacterized protein YndB with AHSA1/START domain